MKASHAKGVIRSIDDLSHPEKPVAGGIAEEREQSGICDLSGVNGSCGVMF